MDPVLPLFPLQLVVFVGEDLNLHIFEPRYQQLVKEAEEDAQPFGIPAFIDGKVMPVGTRMRLKRIVKRYPDGKLDVETQGIGLFRITEFYNPVPEKLYSGASVQDMPFSREGDILAAEQILQQVQYLFALLGVQKDLPQSPAELSTYDIGHHVGFSLEQEYEFLCITEETDRQQFMLGHLEQFIPVVEEANRLRERVKMNGHFKNIIPPKF